MSMPVFLQGRPNVQRIPNTEEDEQKQGHHRRDCLRCTVIKLHLTDSRSRAVAAYEVRDRNKLRENRQPRRYLNVRIVPSNLVVDFVVPNQVVNTERDDAETEHRSGASILTQRRGVFDSLWHVALPLETN